MVEAALSISLSQPGPIPLDASLGAEAGVVMALVGPSGSGKTTILRAVAGLYRPRHGRVVVNGAVWLDTERGIDVPPHQRRVGMVFQSYALFPHLTALGNVMAALGHLPAAERRARALTLLGRVHLSGFEDRKPAALSGGQQQRVAVARALARDPDVLLLDEPFSAVDKVTRQRLYVELRDLTLSLSLPILFVTHDFDEAARVAGRMCLIDQGRVIQSGTPREVLARPVSARAAALVDLKNVFSARVVRRERGRIWLDWAGRSIEADAPPETMAAIAQGQALSWAIPATQVLISRTDVSVADETPNRFAATISDLVHLSESVSVKVTLDGPDRPELSMTLPAHYARRTGLVAGSAVTIALMPDGIHLMMDA
jgi:molybdate transport system ATP-binding protein